MLLSEEPSAEAGEPAPAPESSADLILIKGMIREARYPAAEQAAREIIARNRAGSAGESPETAVALRYLVHALYLSNKTRDPETRQLAEESVALSRRVFGDSHPEYASSLGLLGNVLQWTDHFDEARNILREALTIREEAFGPSSPEVALILMDLVTIEGRTSHFPEARALIGRAVSIVESIQDPKDPDLAGIPHTYGKFLDTTGDLLGAEKSFLRALEIREQLLPPAHPATANTLLSLGWVRLMLGDFASARELLERALAMTEQTLGPENYLVARVVSNLAQLTADTGRPDLAVPYQRRAVSILLATRGEDHSETAQYRSELGLFLARAGDWEGAQALLRPALRTQEEKLGPFHEEVGHTLLRLANVEAAAGDTQAAAEHYQRAIQLFQQIFNPRHFLIAEGLDGQAHLRFTAGDLEEAETLLRQATALQEGALGRNHPDVAELLVDLAEVGWVRGDGKAALADSLRAEEILRAHFGEVIRGLSQREALAFQRIRATGLGVALSVLAGTPPRERNPEWLRQVWSAIMRSRALVLDQIASRNEFAAVHRDEKSAALARQVAAAANRLAAMIVKGPDPSHPEGYRSEFEQALAVKEKLERDLADATLGSGGSGSAGGASVEAIRAALPPGTGLLAYVRYSRLRGAASAGDTAARSRGSDSVRSYAAFLLRPEQPEPRFFDLGDAEVMESLVSGWRRHVLPPTSGSLRAGSSAEQAYRVAGDRLRARIWDPLARDLAGLRQVMIVPDGSLTLVNFAALPSGDEGYLLERAPILHYLSTERDLLKTRRNGTTAPRILVMGGPDFDVAPPALAALPETEAPSGAPGIELAVTGDSYRGLTSACEDFKALRFDSVPGAANEAIRLKDRLLEEKSSRKSDNATVEGFIGGLASEPSFKRWAPSSTLLHVATHGFFLGASCGRVSWGTPGSSAGWATHEDPLRGGAFLENPLLLSGLALAGANQRARASLGADDGILTAEEIAAMDLSNARWVVLSACETAVGEIRSGEGVLGLRRAFQLAGAQTIIMSLWKVDDRATFEWMQRLYDAREQGLSTSAAVHEASLKVMKDRRAKGRSTHPFYWGAFVAAGDWR